MRVLYGSHIEVLSPPIHTDLLEGCLSSLLHNEASERHLGDLSHIWRVNENYVPQEPKENQHLILKENM